MPTTKPASKKSKQEKQEENEPIEVLSVYCMVRKFGRV